MTCLAVWTAILPKSSGGSSSTKCSPACKCLLFLSNVLIFILFALSSSGKSSTSSTTSKYRNKPIFPLFLSIFALISCSKPYFVLPALAMANSIASITSSGDMPFSLAIFLDISTISIELLSFTSKFCNFSP